MVRAKNASIKQTTTTTIKVIHTHQGPKGLQRKTTSMTIPGAFRLVFEGVAHE